jgi:hypothetical protein
MVWKGQTEYKGKKLYKVLSGGKSPHVENFVWSLPTQRKNGTWKPGKIHRDPKGKPGFHLTWEPSSWCCEDMEVYSVEAGEIEKEYDLGGVVTTHTCRLLRRLNADELFSLRIIEGVRPRRIRSGQWLAIRDAAVDVGGIAEVSARDKSAVSAFGDAHVFAQDNSKIKAYDTSVVRAYDDVSAAATGRAIIIAVGGVVEASGHAQVHATESVVAVSDQAVVRASQCPRVTAVDSAHVFATESLVEASGHSTVHAYNGSIVKASGRASVYADTGSTVEATENAIVITIGTATTVRACGSAIVISSEEADGVITITESATHIRAGGN